MCVFVIFLLTGVAMSAPGKDLEILEVGSYAELAPRPNPENFTIGFFPSLVSNLMEAEDKKGSALTQAEVLAIRDGSAVAVVPEDRDFLEKAQGYRDIDPSNCWEEWQEQRDKLSDR